MNNYLSYPLINNELTVNIPKGFPELMMIVLKELLRDPPETEFKAYSFIADYCKCMMVAKRGEENLVTLVSMIAKPNVEIYMKRLERSGYSINELNILAGIIQRGWKRYKSSLMTKSLIDITKEQNKDVCTSDTITEDVMLEPANELIIKIPSAWKKYRKSILSYTSFTKRMSTQFELLEEFDYEYDSDDMERVNVVKKYQEDYVPPIPDFLDYSFKHQSSITNITKETMFEDENGYEDSIN